MKLHSPEILKTVFMLVGIVTLLLIGSEFAAALGCAMALAMWLQEYRRRRTERDAGNRRQAQGPQQRNLQTIQETNEVMNGLAHLHLCMFRDEFVEVMAECLRKTGFEPDSDTEFVAKTLWDCYVRDGLVGMYQVYRFPHCIQKSVNDAMDLYITDHLRKYPGGKMPTPDRDETEAVEVCQ